MVTKKTTKTKTVKTTTQKAAPKKVSDTPKTAVKAKAPAKKVASKTPLKSSTTRAKRKIEVTPEQRYQMIAESAYLKAEKRGFVGGSEASDWLTAEYEIDLILGNK